MLNLIVAYKRNQESNIFISDVIKTLYWKEALILAIKQSVMANISETFFPILNEEALRHIYEEVLALPNDLTEAKRIAKDNGWEFSIKELNGE